MPDINGVLSVAERESIAQEMQLKFQNATCPWCGSPNWEVGLAMSTNVPVGPGGVINLNGQIMPQVTLISPCGYIASFAAKLMGVNI